MSYIEYEKEFRLIELEKEEVKIRKILDEIIEDYKNDVISKNDLDMFKDKYMFELNKILMEKEDLNNNNSSKETIDRINRIKKLGKLDYIDRKVLSELVDVIYVHENKNIEVVFKYKDIYKDALRFLNS